MCQAKILCVVGARPTFDLMIPWRDRLFLLFMSHKVCRLIALFGLVALFASDLLVHDGWAGYLLTFQARGYSLALVGWGLARVGVRERWTSTAFVGAVRFARGDTMLWTKLP